MVSENFTVVMPHNLTNPHDLGVAASTSRGEKLLIAVLTVHVVLFLHKADVGQRHVAVVTVKLLGVPGPAKGHQEWTPATTAASF